MKDVKASGGEKKSGELTPLCCDQGRRFFQIGNPHKHLFCRDPAVVPRRRKGSPANERKKKDQEKEAAA